jgi:hypothetical protein
MYQLDIINFKVMSNVKIDSSYIQLSRPSNDLGYHKVF